VHLLVNELCEYQNALCNDKNFPLLATIFTGNSCIYTVNEVEILFKYSLID